MSSWNSSRRRGCGTSLRLARKPRPYSSWYFVRQPPAPLLEGVLEQRGDQRRCVVDPQLVPGLVAVAGEAGHPLDVALDEGRDDLPLPLPPVAALDLGGDGEADGSALEVPGERGVERLVEVVDPEERDVVGARHHPEVLGVDVAEAQHGRHPRVLAGHVAVEEQRGAPEEGVHRAGELVELRPRALGPVVDPGPVVLADRSGGRGSGGRARRGCAAAAPSHRGPAPGRAPRRRRTCEAASRAPRAVSRRGEVDCSGAGGMAHV